MDLPVGVGDFVGSWVPIAGAMNHAVVDRVDAVAHRSGTRPGMDLPDSLPCYAGGNHQGDHHG